MRNLCKLDIKNVLMLQAGGDLDPGEFVGLLYRDRMRTLEDKQRVSSVTTD